jgi:hypothetical protein
MSKLRVHGFAVSLDGYGAGPNQDLDNPLGTGLTAAHRCARGCIGSPRTCAWMNWPAGLAHWEVLWMDPAAMSAH